MGYYQGDYRAGDYYGGDPGFGSFFGRIAKGVFSGVKGMLGFGGGARTTQMVFPGVGRMGEVAAIAKAQARRVGAMIVKHPVLTAAGAAGTIGVLSGRMEGRMGMRPAGEKGMHLSKKTGRLVRNRHMNVCNQRALRRSLRRAHGFARIAMRTIHLLHPKKKAHFGGFKKRRRARV